MSPLTVIEEHLRICDEVHQCVLAENRFLRQHQRPPEADLIDRKSALRARLDASVVALRALPASEIRQPELRARIEQARSRILQILQLDKENEQLLLRCSLAPAKPADATAPTGAFIRKIYERR